VTDTAPASSDATSTVACFGLQSFTHTEQAALQAEAQRIFGSCSPAGNPTEAGREFILLFFKHNFYFNSKTCSGFFY
jgi:hypothetical protein